MEGEECRVEGEVESLFENWQPIDLAFCPSSKNRVEVPEISPESEEVVEVFSYDYPSTHPTYS